MNVVYGYSRLTPVFIRVAPILTIAAAVAAVAAVFFFLIKKVVEVYRNERFSLRNEIIRDVIPNFNFSSSNVSSVPSTKRKTEDIPYKQMEPEKLDRERIGDLIGNLGNESKFSLLFKASWMKELGEQVSNIHPLKFLEVIFLDLSLRECLSKIMKDYFKRTEFINGLGARLTLEVTKGVFDIYLVDFLNALKSGPGISLNDIRTICKAHRWTELVEYLLEHILLPAQRHPRGLN